VPIVGIDTGPLTDAAAGTVLQWTSPRPGCALKATVQAQSDGSGLTGGHNQETEEEAQDRLVQLHAIPPASGNDAAYQAEAAKTPGVPVEQAFTYPGIAGAGTTGMVFTLRRNAAGGNRIPNATQIAAVLAYLSGRFPADDGLFVGTLVAVPTTVALRVTWDPRYGGWADAVPWPTYSSPMVVVSASLSIPLGCTVENGSVAPQVGNTIGFYDAAAQKFRRKKIGRVVGTGPWILAFDATNGQSDTTYAPVAGQPVVPWSDSLDSLVAPVLAYFDGLGPGEQVGSFYDPGTRQRRSPAPPAWPNDISNRLLAKLFPVPQVGDVTLAEPTVPHATPVGSATVSSNLLTLGALAAFPQ